MPSSIYKYYPTREGQLACIVCDYPYALGAPLSTLKKHLRVKHNFSIRRPLTRHQLERARAEAAVYSPNVHPTRCLDIPSLLNPATTLEERIASWALHEEIPIDKLAKDSFVAMFQPLTLSPQELRFHYTRLLANPN